VDEGEITRFAHLDEGEMFDVIVGTDICYESDHPELLRAVVSRRLKRGGKLFILNAVRSLEIHRRLVDLLGSMCRYCLFSSSALCPPHAPPTSLVLLPSPVLSAPCLICDQIGDNREHQQRRRQVRGESSCLASAG